MVIVGAIILLIVGVVMMCFPDIVYEITESWKSNASDGPSDPFKLYTRIEGAFVCLVSIAAIIVTLVTA